MTRAAKKVKAGLPEPVYKVGTAARHKYDPKGRRARIVTCKWSSVSGYWYELRYPNNEQRSLPESEIEGTED